MDPVVIVPLVAAAAALAAVGPRSRHLHPRVAAWLICAGIVAVVISVLATSWVVSLGLMSGAPFVRRLLSWCLSPMVQVSPDTRLMGAVALILSALSTLHVGRVATVWWRSRIDRSAGVRVVVDRRPLAYVQAGQGGGVVVSTGMLDVLLPAERRAMLAHEVAHLRHRHDRFLAVGRLVADLPVVGERLFRHLHFALERWADEEAARVVGNRSTVAHAVARAALAQDDHVVAVLSIDGGDIVGRVECLLGEPPSVHLPTLVLFAAVGLGAAVQLHHLPAIARMIC